ncbi:hypothetical protein [Nitrosopumilus sp.]|uniref:hypothetical protein n=1 Tax=Nitrosopumilus sp. TaxID=2024843 RepID=UPI003D0A7174
MDKVLIEKVQTLLSLGIGDVGRLEHIKSTLEQDLSLYISDAKYLDNLIQTHLPDSPNPAPESDTEKKDVSTNSEQPNNNDKPEPNPAKPNQLRISSTRNYVRPTGVTILAILVIISGISAIAFGSIFSVLVGFVGASAFDMISGTVMGIFSGAMIATGIVSFVMAWGLLKGKSWAWTLTIILTIISLIIDIPSMNVIGLVIDAVILYYLYRPHVKAYFGKNAEVL